MVPWVKLEGVYADCANVSTLPVTVQKLASTVDAFDSRVCTLEATTGLEEGGGVALPGNYIRNHSRRNDSNGGKNDNGIRLVPSQDGPFFYSRSHLSELQNCALIFSTNFHFIFIFKNA